MKKISLFKRSLLALAFLYPMLAQAEILALVNYQSKPELMPKREGLALIDLDIESENCNGYAITH